jgi:hypothetical protein
MKLAVSDVSRAESRLAKLERTRDQLQAQVDKLTAARVGNSSEDGTEEGTCSVPQQEDSTDDDEEDVESLPLEEKRTDPFWRKRICNNIEGWSIQALSSTLREVKGLKEEDCTS